MEDREDLKKLENIVEKLISAYNNLKSDKHDIEEMLSQSQVENEKLQNQLSQLQDEKSHVHDRVAGLLGTIEEWEKTQNLTISDDSDDEVSGVEADRQKEVESSSQLFTMDK
jgi:FtsZ-binding cell division protein ZapB